MQSAKWRWRGSATKIFISKDNQTCKKLEAFKQCLPTCFVKIATIVAKRMLHWIFEIGWWNNEKYLIEKKCLQFPKEFKLYNLSKNCKFCRHDSFFHFPGADNLQEIAVLEDIQLHENMSWLQMDWLFGGNLPAYYKEK